MALGYSKGLGAIVWEIDVRNTPHHAPKTLHPLSALCSLLHEGEWSIGSCLSGQFSLQLLTGVTAGGHDRQWCRRVHRVSVSAREGDCVAAAFVPRGDRHTLQAYDAARGRNNHSFKDELEPQMLLA